MTHQNIIISLYYPTYITRYYNVMSTPSPVLTFDGVNDAVNTGIPTWTYSTQFRTTMTVECWFKTSDTSNQKTTATFVSRHNTINNSAESQFTLYMQPTGEIVFGLTNTANTVSYHTTTASYKDANWHHVAVTYDSASGVKIIYVDGVMSRTDTVPVGFGLLSNNTTKKLVFGSDANGVDSAGTDRQFRGAMSDIRIWNVARSAADISNNYQPRLIGIETGLVGYWELNHGNGTGWGSYTTALDNTNNRAHGMLVNFASPASNWTLSNLYFRPRISNLVLGPKNGNYVQSDASFSFIDPSSNSLGAFTYSIDSSAVTITNGAATIKTVYATAATTTGSGGTVTIPALTIYEFPEIASLASWQIDISFTATGGAGTWRALIGDMYNQINSIRGWGISISTSNRIHWSWTGSTNEPQLIYVSLNTPYVLTAAQNAGVITLTLRNVASTYISSLSISNLVAFYPFDSSGNDTSTNNNHLTNVNNVTYNTSDYIRGWAAASFGLGNYFERANDGRFSPDNFTLAFWVKPVNSNGVHQAIASCRNIVGPVWSGWFIYISPNNDLEFFTGTGSTSSGGSVYSNFGGTITTWVHVAITMTKSTGAFILYINGTSFTSGTRTYVNNTGSNLRIGAGANEGSAMFFMGNGSRIDEFRLYSKVLTAAEIGTIVADSSHSSSFSVGSNILGKGPVTIGGWRLNTGENFPGTISYANASVPTNTRIAVINASTAGFRTVTATQAGFNDFGTGTLTAPLTTGPAPTVFSTTFTVPAKFKGDPPFAFTPPVSNNPTGAFSYFSSNENVATIGAGIATIIGVGTTTITVTQAASVTHTSNTATATLVVSYSPNQVNADLSGVNLSNINFTNFNFTDANMTNANLTNANLTNANLTNTRIVGATLTGITFTDGQKIQLRQNADNVNIAAIALPETISAESITAVIPTLNPADLVNIQTFRVLTPDINNNNSVTVVPSVVEGFYIGVSPDTEVSINGVVYQTTGGGQVVDNNGTPVNFIKIGTVLYRVYAGSIIGIPVDPNYYKVKSYGLGTVLTTAAIGSSSGNVGATGDTGPVGFAGINGATGATGVFGYQGVTGSTGPVGATGPQGPTGATGVWGVTGPNGVVGATGPTGEIGATGPNSEKGNTGATGVRGPTGYTGIYGRQGVSGITGNTGATGAIGATGPRGESVEVGNTGATGANDGGATGANIWGRGAGNPSAVYYNIGRLGIQTDPSLPANTQYLLDVSGNIKTNGVMNISDYRIKTEIMYLSDNAHTDRQILSNQIHQLRPVMFQNRLHGHAWEYGFLAHEVQEIFPELVNGTKDNEDLQAVSYHQLFAICCEEIKTLNARLERLEKA